MKKLGYEEITEANNGEEALARYKEARPDLVLMDINMPEMNGIELVDEMNNHPEYQDIPVVIVSTEGSKSRIEQLRQKGIKGYLRKPFTPENIRDVIIETLGGWDAE